MPNRLPENPSEEQLEDHQFWSDRRHVQVFNAITSGKSLEEAGTEAGRSAVEIAKTLRHPSFLRRFQDYIFNGSVSKAVIKIQLMQELWINIRKKTDDPDNKLLLGQLVRLLSEKDVKGMISPEFMALIVNVKKNADELSGKEKEKKVNKILDYQEAEVEEPPNLKNGKHVDPTVDSAEQIKDKQGSAD